MNAALLFSTSPQPADGLSLDSLPAVVLPGEPGPANKFSAVMDGALSPRTGYAPAAGQEKPGVGSKKATAPSAEIPAVMRQMLPSLTAVSGEAVATTETEEKPEPDQSGKPSLGDGAAAMMMMIACQLPPPLQPSLAPSAATGTANTMTISSQAVATPAVEPPLIVLEKSDLPGVLDELSPMGNKSIETGAKTQTTVDSRVVTTSPRGEADAVPTPAVDQPRGLVETLRPLDSLALTRPQPESSQERPPAAGGGVNSGEPARLEGSTIFAGHPELSVATKSADVLSVLNGRVVVDPAVITAVEKTIHPVGQGAGPQSSDRANTIAQDESAAATSMEPVMTERGVSDKPAGIVNRRPFYSSSEDGSGPVTMAGIGGARSESGMMKSAEQDQSAGLRLQRLPSGKADSIAAESRAGDLAAFRSGPRAIPDGDFVFRPIAADFASQAAVSRFDAFDSSAAMRAGGTAAERVERVEHLILKEASVVRQSGAGSLAVVLKPDAQTELFLQINHRAGQIEAVVRFDRGDAASLGLYWPQLQESLARLDVQLQPMKEFTPSTADHGSMGSFSSADHQDSSSSGHRTPRSLSRDGENAFGETVPGRESMRPAVPKARRVSGWESWA